MFYRLKRSDKMFLKLYMNESQAHSAHSHRLVPIQDINIWKSHCKNSNPNKQDLFKQCGRVMTHDRMDPGSIPTVRRKLLPNPRLIDFWTIFEQKLNKLWTIIEWNLNELWTNFEQSSNDLWVIFEWSLSDLWTIFKRSLNDLWTIFERSLSDHWCNFWQSLSDLWAIFERFLSNL